MSFETYSGKVLSTSFQRLPNVDVYRNNITEKGKKFYKLFLVIVFETKDGKKITFKTPPCLEEIFPWKSFKYHIVTGNDWIKKYGKLLDKENPKKNWKSLIRKGDRIVIRAKTKKGNAELYYAQLVSHTPHVKL